ncbi:hypothetical protein B0H11DRAFT_2083681 [Mycena galericulata]|nr:hypothetical protein B0H11DRAFT_2083681 [Mycena galericulata]
MFSFLPRLSSLLHVWFATVLLVFFTLIVDLLYPTPVCFGPVTLEEHFAALVPEAFAHYREFERLQELYHPAILTMTTRYNSDPDGPILLDVEVRYPDETVVYENDDDIDIDIDNVNDDDNDKDDDASRTHRAVPITKEPSTTPRPGAFPPSRTPPSTAPILSFTMVVFSMVAAGTLFVGTRLRRKATCSVRQVATRPASATRPRFKSSGETRRCWVFPLQRRRKFRPLLSSIDEDPCSCGYSYDPQVPSTSDGAAYTGAEQQDVKLKEIAAPSEPNVINSHNEKPVSTRSRALTDGNTKSTTVLPRSRTQTAPGQLPGQLKLVPTSPTRVGVPVRRIVQVSTPQVPVSSSSTLSPLPLSVPPATQSMFGGIVYETPTVKTSSVIYRTPAVKTPPNCNLVLYETPAVNTSRSEILHESRQALRVPSGLMCSTSASTIPIQAVPDYWSKPTPRSSDIVFHGRSGPPLRLLGHQRPLPAFSPNSPNPFACTQLQSATYPQYQPYYHHPYLIGVAQARAPRAW